MTRQPIYLDNAATSWPKPPEVKAAMVRCLDELGGNPGRSGHRLSIATGRLIDDAREILAVTFGVADPMRVIFTMNATMALNLALKGLLQPGQHVITSSMEHNSVMRPLRALEQRGVAVTVVAASGEGVLDPAAVAAAIQPTTAMIALTHASNVVGTLMPIAEIGRIARGANLLFLVDAAATAGVIPIDMNAQQIDLLAFTGHKSLYGPTGTGGLVIGERISLDRLEPLVRGGTGSRSAEEFQPTFLPDAFESGTLNFVGIAGLLAATRWIAGRGMKDLRQHQIRITQRLIDGLGATTGIKVYGTHQAELQAGSVSFRIEGLSPSGVGFRLDQEFGVLCRVGLHCAPTAHQSLGTFPDGTVRFAPGAFTTPEEIETATDAVAQLAGEVTRE